MAVTRVYASFVVQHAAATSAAVTTRLGVEPSQSFEIGDEHLRGTRRRGHSSWSLESTLAKDGDDLEGHLRELLDRLLPHATALHALAVDGYTMFWSCFINEAGGQGGVELSATVLTDLAKIPASLAFDIYGDDHHAPAG